MIFMVKHLTRNLLFGILIVAFLIRFWGAGNYDLFGDEAVDAFRGIGYIDFLGTSFQTQPIDWYQDSALPRWTKLSFHDFPPLAMIIQNIFFRIFEDSILTARLPAIFLGTLSVFFIYLIIKKFFNEKMALLAALLMAINSVMIWISRTSLLEPILIFFILFSIYAFFKFMENKRYWWFFGISLGLVALTKYTGAFLVPVYLIYLAYRSYWIDNSNRSNWLYFFAALGIALLLFSPVVVYNIFLYNATGHFDLQIAFLLGQETPEWTALIGKAQAPFSEILINLLGAKSDESGTFFSVISYKMIILLAALGGLIYAIFRFQKPENKSERGGILFFFLYLIFYLMLLIAIGSAHRFLSVLGPAILFFSTLAVCQLWELKPLNILANYSLKGFVILFLFWEIFHSINAIFFQMPDYGMARLDRYFDEEFRGRKSAVIPSSDNPHLNEVIQRFAQKNRDFKGERIKSVIVFNDNVTLPTLSWVFYRRFFYQSTPALFIENFYKALEVEGKDYFKDFDIFFVQSTRYTLLNKMKLNKTIGQEFETQLIEAGLSPEKIIYGQNNLPMFKIYKFRL